MQNILEEKLGAIECESGNAEVQWKNIKECVLDTISDLVGKVEKRARKPWITQEMDTLLPKVGTFFFFKFWTQEMFHASIYTHSSIRQVNFMIIP